MRAPASFAAALAALALAGCSSTFTPGSVLADLRILALAPSPPELVGEEPVSLDATVYVPGGAPATYEWTFCPLTAGPNGAYRCVVPQCLVPLGTGAGLTHLEGVSPGRLALDCLAALGGSLPGDPGQVTLPNRIETAITLRVTAEGVTREAVQRVAVNRTAPADLNARVPVITAFAVPTSGRPGEKLPITVQVDPASIEQYRDGTGRLLTEQVVIEVYTTEGRFDFDRGDAPTASFQLELKELTPGAREALVYAIARDLRGGEAVAGPVTVTLAP